MIREIEVYETSDGKRHDTKEKAQEHVADAIREAIDAALEPLIKGGMLSKNDAFRIVMAIIPDANAAKVLGTHFFRWLDF